MKIVFLTNKCPHGMILLKGLKDRNIKIDAVIIENKVSQGILLKGK